MFWEGEGGGSDRSAWDDRVIEWLHQGRANSGARGATAGGRASGGRPIFHSADPPLLYTRRGVDIGCDVWEERGCTYCFAGDGGRRGDGVHVLLREFPVGLLDLRLVRVWAYPKDLIIVLVVRPDSAVLERQAYQPHQNKGD